MVVLSAGFSFQLCIEERLKNRKKKQSKGGMSLPQSGSVLCAPRDHKIMRTVTYTLHD